MGNLMKHVLSVMSGGVAAGLFVVASGVLSIRALAQEAGAVVDARNVVVAVARPSEPYLPAAATAALGALVVLLLVLGARRLARSVWAAGTAAFVVVTAALVVVGYALRAERSGGGSVVGLAEGLRGWLEKGGSHPTVHVVLLVAVGLLVGAATLRSARRRPEARTG